MDDDNPEALSALIGAIYDAALDAAVWPDALGKSAKYLAGVGALLFTKDATTRNFALHHADARLDPAYVKLYAEKYSRIDPSTSAHYFADIGEPVSIMDIGPIDEFRATRIYREWAQPQGLVDFLTVSIDKNATTVAMYGLFRHERQGMVDDVTRQRTRLIAPHIRRAVVIGRAIDLKAAQAASFADAFDRLSSAMLFIDATGRIVHANAAAHRMLALGNVVRAAPGGRISSNDPNLGEALRKIFEDAGKGDNALGIQGIAFPIVARDGENYVGHVLPLTSGARTKTGSAFAAAAVLLVQKAELAMPAAPEVLAKTFKLTPTELRVLLAVSEFGGVAEIADSFGISETTVKFHLKSLFDKTGARRQTELVKLLAGFTTPLAS
jgi:DNA-binding CsgD family transcriptional regulator/PAS domain-containing protein